MRKFCAQDERVLVIADRLYGSGPYKKLLADLDYVLNEWVSPSHHHSMAGGRDRADNRLVVRTARRR